MVLGLTVQQLILFSVLIAACAGIMTERLRLDIAALLIILALFSSGILKADEALAGFMSEPAIVIAAVFVLSAGIYRTGLSTRVGGWVGRMAGKKLPGMLAVLMPAAALMSAFTHHVTITAALLPVALSLARERRIPASKLLMPLAFGSSLGTTMTVIAAPSFLVASQLLQQAGRPALGIFSIAPIGLALIVAGTLYMAPLGPLVLPKRRGAEDPQNRFKLDRYLTELRILEGSDLAGKTVAEVRKMPHYDFKIVGWLREGRRLRGSPATRQVCEGDVLLVEAQPEDLLIIQAASGLELEPTAQYGDHGNGRKGKVDQSRKDEQEANEELLQVVVAPDSSLIGQTLSEIDFRRRYRAVVLGLWRRQQLAPLAGATAMVLVRCVTPTQAYRAIDQRMYIFIAGAIPLGTAMGKTGAAKLLADWLQALTAGWNIVLVLFAIYMVVGILVQFMGSTRPPPPSSRR